MGEYLMVLMLETAARGGLWVELLDGEHEAECHAHEAFLESILTFADAYRAHESLQSDLYAGDET